MMFICTILPKLTVVKLTAMLTNVKIYAHRRWCNYSNIFVCEQ